MSETDSHAFVISPHRDDAALSIAATLARLSLLGVRLTVTSCFTVSEWAPRLGAGVSRSQITAVRLAEDERFIRQLGPGAALLSLDLLDGPLRADWQPYKTWPDVNDNRDFGAIAEVLREKLTINAANESACFMPLALEHPDHLIARTAGLAVSEHQPLLFYEDVPYVFWFDEDDIRAHVAQVEQLLSCELLPRILHAPCDRPAWHRAASIYASQFSPPQIDSMYGLLQRRGGERVWATSSAFRWLDLLPRSRLR